MASHTRRRRRNRTNHAPSRPHGSTPRWAYIGLAIVAVGVIALVVAALTSLPS